MLAAAPVSARDVMGLLGLASAQTSPSADVPATAASAPSVVSTIGELVCGLLCRGSGKGWWWCVVGVTILWFTS